MAKTQKTQAVQPVRFAVPRSPEFYANQISYVDTKEAAASMVELAYQRPIAFIGIDSEFNYDRPSVDMGNRRHWNDPRSIHPLLVSLSMAEHNNGTIALYRFVIDVQKPEVLKALGEVLRLTVCFVAHFLQVELFTLWQLGLRAPDQVWDTWTCEKALNLGRYHARYKTDSSSSDSDQIQAQQDTENQKAANFSLVSTCQRYQTDYSFAADKERLQQSFINHPAGQSFTTEQIDYAAADADAVAKLYLPQVQAAAIGGILSYLTTIEMPWVITNAQMNWTGVRVDEKKRDKALMACRAHEPKLLTELRQQGVQNPRSNPQLQAFFESKRLLHLFKRGDGYSFDKDLLRKFQDRHPSITLIRAVRRVQDLNADAIMRPELVGADGRLHPEHRQLGAESGRQSSRWPNVLGLDRVLRPMIVPDEGRAIGEVDWSQIEVGISAAVYGDEQLIDMFNTGDVYSAMAQRFFTQKLSQEDRDLPSSEFKKKHRKLRDQMKICTLGIIYGLTPRGLSAYLDCPETQAKSLQQQFMGMFQKLNTALKEAVNYGSTRGYATTVMGLRRERHDSGPPSQWERNWMTNFPVQGSAAVVFKAAGNRLARLYEQYDAWLIIPFHDAFIFETPADTLEKVADLTSAVMCQTVQEYFPMLKPRVEINADRPDCWNKDGKADAFDKWLEDPLYVI